MIDMLIQILISLQHILLMAVLPLSIIMFLGNLTTLFLFEEKLIKSIKVNHHYFYNSKQCLTLLGCSFCCLLFGTFFKSMDFFNLIGNFFLHLFIFVYFINYFLIGYLKGQTSTNLINHKWILIGYSAKIYSFIMILISIIYILFISKYFELMFFAALNEVNSSLNKTIALVIFYLVLIIIPVTILFINIKNIRKPFSLSRQKKYKFFEKVYSSK
ncbi:MAG: hypothetical protein CMP39_00735 [Rickettsiales bacterium]|nr:hypothetical protein [Rickettsiales bacterium]